MNEASESRRDSLVHTVQHLKKQCCMADYRYKLLDTLNACANQNLQNTAAEKPTNRGSQNTINHSS